MSSQSISQIISSIKERFRKLQNKLQSNETSEQDDPNHQESKAPARCITAAASESRELEEKSQGSQWWARLYRGLVIDSSARHYRQMGIAVWLFLYFLLNANWKTGRLYRRLSTVSEDTGINIFAVRRWLRVLQRNGYINACYNGRFWVIEVNKWRPLQLPFTRKSKSSASAKFRKKT
ncbi:MAG: hypothetical protein M3209_17620 [Acidobacteriota bacterium]|nr:hypothetical protein [Acidobacteriota bacterium]